MVDLRSRAIRVGLTASGFLVLVGLTGVASFRQFRGIETSPTSVTTHLRIVLIVFLATASLTGGVALRRALRGRHIRLWSVATLAFVLPVLVAARFLTEFAFLIVALLAGFTFLSLLRSGRLWLAAVALVVAIGVVMGMAASVPTPVPWAQVAGRLVLCMSALLFLVAMLLPE